MRPNLGDLRTVDGGSGEVRRKAEKALEENKELRDRLDALEDYLGIRTKRNPLRFIAEKSGTSN